MQRVEGVEELLHRLFLALQELDVVDQEHVDVAVAPLERPGLALADRVDEVVRELLGVHVAHADVRVQVVRVVADRVQEVRLAEAGLPVDEEGVVGLGRRLGDRDSGSVREPVRRSDDERLEDVLRVQPGRLGGRTLRGGSGQGALVLDLGAQRHRFGRARRERGGGRRLGAELRIDRDAEPDVTAECAGHRGDELVAHARLEVGTGLLVGDGDEDGVVEDRQRLRELDECDLPRRHVGAGLEDGDGLCPDICDVLVRVGHQVIPSSSGGA
ncbi:hypothetical protein D3C74_326930 [compost metagenome]